jgi:hypothetical protein
MHIYSITNLENLKLYDPSMLDEDEDIQVLPSIEDMASNAQEKSPKDIILQNNIKMTRKG